MRIVFRDEDLSDKWDDKHVHSILVDGKEMISQSDAIEPEDVRFYRDLTSPHQCENIIRLVIDAVRNGEEIELIHEKEEGFI